MGSASNLYQNDCHFRTNQEDEDIHPSRVPQDLVCTHDEGSRGLYPTDPSREIKGSHSGGRAIFSTELWECHASGLWHRPRDHLHSLLVLLGSPR